MLTSLCCIMAWRLLANAVIRNIEGYHSLEATDDVSGNISRLLEIEKKTKEFIKTI